MQVTVPKAALDGSLRRPEDASERGLRTASDSQAWVRCLRGTLASGMRQRVVATVFALVALACAAQASTAVAKVRVSVTPSIGKQRTSFVVRFRAPSATGTFASIRSHYVVSAAGRGKRCAASASVAMAPTRRGQKVRTTLKPKGRGRIWCVGKFHGRIVQISEVVCPPIPKMVCPDIEIAPKTIARFTFRVKKSTAGTTTTPGAGPSFAGLVSAVRTCAPFQPAIIPMPIPEGNVTLSWQAATDPNTPSSQIVYEIFYSATSGGENYSDPSWTTGPGATHFTVALKGFASAFFVVRARDTAGNEDQNTIQRMAVTDCPAPLNIRR